MNEPHFMTGKENMKMFGKKFHINPNRIQDPKIFKIFDDQNQIKFAYLAGIIDGEGCIYDARHIAKNKFVLTINTTDKKLWEWLKSKLDKGCSYQEKRQKPKPHHKQVYVFQAVAMNDVIEILEAVIPYLIIKKEKAPAADSLPFTEAFKLSFEGSVEESSKDILNTLSKNVQNSLLQLFLSFPLIL